MNLNAKTIVAGKHDFPHWIRKGLITHHFLFKLHSGDQVEGIDATIPKNTFFHRYYFAHICGSGVTLRNCKIHRALNCAGA